MIAILSFFIGIIIGALATDIVFFYLGDRDE